MFAASAAVTVMILSPSDSPVIIQFHVVAVGKVTSPGTAEVFTVTVMGILLSLVPVIVWLSRLVGVVTGLKVIAGATVSTVNIF